VVKKGSEMRKLGLSGWAAISEIVATVAVVFSLLLVAYSIMRNTDEMETSNSNLLYELNELISGDLSRDSGLATIFVKMAQKEKLSDTERFQYMNVQHRYLGVWEIAWTQYKSGSLAFVDWRDWDQYLANTVTEALPHEWWIESRAYYKPEFAEHVDRKYAGN
jgi:hypothetical protein